MGHDMIIHAGGSEGDDCKTSCQGNYDISIITFGSSQGALLNRTTCADNLGMPSINDIFLQGLGILQHEVSYGRPGGLEHLGVSSSTILGTGRDDITPVEEITTSFIHRYAPNIRKLTVVNAEYRIRMLMAALTIYVNRRHEAGPNLRVISMKGCIGGRTDSKELYTKLRSLAKNLMWSLRSSHVTDVQTL
ncbi:hypothetical protein K469DRAFT_783051 [Zopfia rhizophila CBS 207.26]|uniref:Uncharacterized protein n=1 Tax=Zopfia rhizophila CBS 207.26 TaxID=1314779 RepID=A0A6A6EWF1_9PEZI|nr:hypothetical protein K469DRAFT_783051 [Zopfia rhizophila CBS 207.26]